MQRRWKSHLALRSQHLILMSDLHSASTGAKDPRKHTEISHHCSSVHDGYICAILLIRCVHVSVCRDHMLRMKGDGCECDDTGKARTRTLIAVAPFREMVRERQGKCPTSRTSHGKDLGLFCHQAVGWISHLGEGMSVFAIRTEEGFAGLQPNRTL